MITTIAAYISPTSVTLATAASTTLSGVFEEVYYGSDNYSALHAALNSVGSGLEIDLSQGGKCYTISTGLKIPPGVRFAGAGSTNLTFNPSPDVSFCSTGSWLMSFDPVNPAILAGDPTSAMNLNGGQSIEGINVYYPQNYSGTFAPYIWPAAYGVSCNFCRFANEIFIGPGTGISESYNNSPAGTTNGHGTVVENIGGESESVFLSTVNVNDTVQNKSLQWLQFHDTSSIASYYWNNLVGWDAHYTDNIQIDGLNLQQCNIGVKFTDGTVLGNTHSVYGGQINNVIVNLCNQAMSVASGTTHVIAQFTNFGYGQQTTPSPGVEFSLGSDNASVQFTNLNFTPSSSGSSIFAIGNGTGGNLLVSNVIGYGPIPAGASLFSMGSGSSVNLSAANFSLGSSAHMGSGGGYYNLRSDRYGSWTPYSAFESPSFTGTGSWGLISSSNYFNPIAQSVHEMRISGYAYVSTGQSGGSIALRMQGFPEITVTGIAATTSGVGQSFDSGWLPVTSGNGILGSLYANATTGVVWDFNGITIEWR